MKKLYEVTQLIRSKNAGPFMLTIDVIFPDKEMYDKVLATGVLDIEKVAPLYGIDAEKLQRFDLPLANAVLDAILQNAPKGADVLDMGCGEGYYTRIVSEGLNSGELSAFDISKDAVKLAAKRAKRASFAVASSYKIPVGNESFGAVYNVFSPLALDEVKRVLAPNGIFIAAIPDDFSRSRFFIKKMTFSHFRCGYFSWKKSKAFFTVSFRVNTASSSELS